MMDADAEPIAPCEQLKHELLNVIDRYSEESDVNIAETLGVLQLIQFALLQELANSTMEEE